MFLFDKLFCVYINAVALKYKLKNYIQNLCTKYNPEPKINNKINEIGIELCYF